MSSTEVLTVKLEDYQGYKVVSKSEDARLCLYRGKENFSMLFKAEGQWLRLFRMPDENEAQRLFKRYNGALQQLFSEEPANVGSSRRTSIHASVIALCRALQASLDVLSDPERTDWTAAHVAAAAGIARHFNSNKMTKEVLTARTSKGQMPLHVAIACGQKGCAEAILNAARKVNAGVDVGLEVTDRKGNNALHLAARTSPELVDWLVAVYGARFHAMIRKQNAKGKNPINIAVVRAEDAAILPKFLRPLATMLADLRAVLEQSVGRDALRPMHQAVARGHLDFIRQLAAAHSDTLNALDGRARTPIFYARDKAVVALLCELNSDLYQRDVEGKTVLHEFVALGRLDLVVQLLLGGFDPNYRGPRGDVGEPDGLMPKSSGKLAGYMEAPLVFAIKNQNSDLFRALVAFGADVVAVGENLKHLTWSGQQRHPKFAADSIAVLSDLGAPDCTCNDCRDAPKTPPMLAQQSLTKYLAAKKASSAAIERFCRLVLEYLQDAGQAPRSRGERDKMLDSLMQDAEEAVAAASGGDLQQQQQGSSNPALRDKDLRLLCLDGGGVRALVLLQALIAMERLFQTLSRKDMVKQFNFIAGTSTGALIASLLVGGQSLRDARKLYFWMMERVLGGSEMGGWEEATAGLSDVLRATFGETKTLEQLLGPPFLLATTARFDIEPAQLRLFRNYTYQHEPVNVNGVKGGPMPLAADPKLVWEAVRCATASPDRFLPYVANNVLGGTNTSSISAVPVTGGASYVDAAPIANNPTLEALSEASRLLRHLNHLDRLKHSEINAGSTRSRALRQRERRLALTLSLGCGFSPARPAQITNMFTTPDFGEKSLAQGLKYGPNARAMSLCVNGIEASGADVDGRSGEAAAWCAGIGAAFLRLNPVTHVDAEKEEAPLRLALALLADVERYLRAHTDEIEALCILLSLD